nr:uncharacterized protein LOC123763174 isoform X2 [Procambarus clarkii]
MLANWTMEVTRVGLVAVLLALSVSAQPTDEGQLQNIDTSNVNGNFSSNDKLNGRPEQVLNVHSTGLREYEDHAEMNMQLSDLSKVQEETTLPAEREEEKKQEQDVVTTEVPEPLPAPLPIKNEGTDRDIAESNVEDLILKISNKTSSIVPRKEAIFTKPSVVPKKGVGEEKPITVINTSDKPNTFTPSVFARKGADPMEQNSSVSVRIEADPKSLLSNNYKLNSNASSSKASGRNMLDLQSVSKNIGKSSGKFKDNLGDEEVHGKQSDSFFSQSSVPISEQGNKLAIMPINTTKLSDSAPQPMVLNADTTTIVPTNLENLINESSVEIHSKPSITTDDLDAASADPDSDSVNFGVVILGLSLFVALAVIVVLIYRKVKDIWMRRHYAHVNFLVDGMYDM